MGVEQRCGACVGFEQRCGVCVGVEQRPEVCVGVEQRRGACVGVEQRRGACVGVEQRCGECVGALRVCERSVLLLSQALCRITRQSPTAFQNVIEKVGLNAVISSLASAICKVQQYMLTLFTAMLSCGIHLQRLIQEKVGLFLLEWCMLHRMPSLQALLSPGNEEK